VTPTDRRTLGALIALAGPGTAGALVPTLLDDLAERCVELLPVDACAVLLADHDGELSLVAATQSQAHVLGLVELGCGRGPVVEAYRTGDAVLCDDLALADGLWVEFALAALGQETRCVVALPLRRRERSLGAIGLFRSATGPLPDEALDLALALADLAAIGVLRTRAAQRRERIATQWREALEDRVVVQQAVGILSERLRLSVDGALDLLAETAETDGVEPPELARRLLRDPSPSGFVVGEVSASAEARSAI
jgi:hypothetical protein